MRRILLLAALLTAAASGYKLNVPRVLLPYHPSLSIEFTLEVKDGCFNWRSTRPDIVSVETLDPNSDGCAERAVITSRTKHSGEHNAVIFAEDPVSGVSLTCAVTVDVVDRIDISTTTKVLFVDAAPAELIVEAFNKEGDRFSTLGAIPFEWFFDYKDGGRPVRIVPFAQSKYDAPPEIEQLEKRKQRGYVVLIEGISTGSAILTAKFTETQFSNVKASGIELSVVAHVLLRPSEDLYVPAQSIVKYRAELIRQQGAEDIALPSNQYSLKLSDTSVCELNVATSEVTANVVGQTEITLIDAYMKPKSGVKPQSAHIYVVDPDSISFAIDEGNVWYLQKGLEYRISVRLSDARGNNMFIPDNAKFETRIPADYFDVLSASNNGTFFHVRAKQTGTTTLRSKFVSIKRANGADIAIRSHVSGEQELHISNKLEVAPYLLVFPYQANRPYTYQPKATGGTGNYRWRSAKTNIATVDEKNGVVKSGEIGHTTVAVEDVFNPRHFAHVQVYVLTPMELFWGESHVEAQIDTDLILNVRLSGFEPESKKMLSFTDCRHIPFRVTVSDPSVFRLDAHAPSKIPEQGRGCATVALRALKSADTKATVQVNQLTQSIDISAFPPLRISTGRQLLMASGSRLTLAFEGGPRPWIHNPSNYFSDASSSDIASINSDSNQLLIQCSRRIADTKLAVKVGNRRSKTNPLPVVITSAIDVCCAIPQRMVLTTKPRPARDNLPACPSFAHSVFFEHQTTLQLTGYGRCVSGIDTDERAFDSLSSAVAQYKVEESHLLKVTSSTSGPMEADKLFAIAKPSGESGTAHIHADVAIVDRVLPAKLTLNLVGVARASPPSVVLWNSPNARGSVSISGGSGHFWVDSAAIAQTVDASVPLQQGDLPQINLRPIHQGVVGMRIYDLCIDGSVLNVNVKVTDISSIRIHGPDLVEVSAVVPLAIEVLDVEHQPFGEADIKAMNLKVDIDRSVSKLEKISGLRYNARGVAVGSATVTAVIQGSANKIITSAPHALQVFAPIRLLPRVVTLVPESVFQFEILGGPQPSREVSFRQDRSGIATVQPNGLITSLKTLGETVVTATITTGSDKAVVTQDCATIRVVSLAGIRVVASSATVEQGEIVHVRIEGLDERETPFAFGGAEYPLTVNWKISAADIIVDESVLTESVVEQNLNRFAAKFLAVKRGRVTVSAVVTVHSRATRHFASRATEFSDSIDVAVLESMRLMVPTNVPKSIIMTPNAILDLVANRPVANVRYSIGESSVASLGGKNNNILRSGAKGSVPLFMQHQGIDFNETSYVSVDVIDVKSIHLDIISPINTIVEAPLTTLPKGTNVRIRVNFRDARGRLFHAANKNLAFRPHRFDLTDIVASDNNRTFEVNLKNVGETVLHVWDATDPKLNTFLRLPVGEMPLPIPVTTASPEFCEAPVPVKSESFAEQYAAFISYLANLSERMVLMFGAVAALTLSFIVLYIGYNRGYEHQVKADTSVFSPRSASNSVNGLQVLRKPKFSSTPISNESSFTPKLRRPAGNRGLLNRSFPTDDSYVDSTIDSSDLLNSSLNGDSFVNRHYN